MATCTPSAAQKPHPQTASEDPSQNLAPRASPHHHEKLAPPPRHCPDKPAQVQARQEAIAKTSRSPHPNKLVKIYGRPRVVNGVDRLRRAKLSVAGPPNGAARRPLSTYRRAGPLRMPAASSSRTARSRAFPMYSARSHGHWAILPRRNSTSASSPWRKPPGILETQALSPQTA